MAGDESLRPELRQDVVARDATVSGRDLYKADSGDIHIHHYAASPALPSGGAAVAEDDAGNSAPVIVRAWSVPGQNRAFAGREELLTIIRNDLLSGDRRRTVQVLHGVGGVGKTELAIEYAHRFSAEYDIVWWLDAADTVPLARDYAALAAKLGCAEPGAEPEAVRREVLMDLHDRTRWLLIFDDAEDPSILHSRVPDGPGHVLITSRLPAPGHLAVSVLVEVLSRDESVELLQRSVSGLSESDASTLAEALGDLPLAIAQAAAFLSESMMQTDQYVSLLEARAADLLSEGKQETYRDGTLTAITTLAYDRLGTTDKDAATLAAICAFLAPKSIPVDWLTAAVGLPAGLATRLADPLKQNRLLAVLSRTSLVHRDNNGLIMHRLTQLILRTCQQAPSALRAHAEAVIIAIAPGEADSPVTWLAWAGILPHLRALDPAGSGSADLHRVAATAAWYLAVSGNSKDALDLATHLHERWSERFTPDAPQALRVADALGQALRAQAHYARARERDEDSLARRRRLYGDDDEATLTSASHLATDLRALGDYDEARTLDEDTLVRRSLMLGDYHPDTLNSANNLGLDLQRLGQYDAAWAQHRDTFTRSRQVLGDDYPETLAAANNLVGDLYGLGDYDGARVLAEDTLARRRKVLGDDHPDTLISANNLANVRRQLCEYNAARELDEDTFARRRRTLGEAHPHTLTSASNLAIDLYLLGEYDAARELDEDTLARSRRVLGEDHPDTLTSASNLATDLHALGQYDAARELNEDTLERRRRVLGDNHPDTRLSETNLAANLREIGVLP
jgi:hypothetical protein